MYLRKLEKDEHYNSKAGKRKETIKMRVLVNEIEQKINSEKSMKTKDVSLKRL